LLPTATGAAGALSLRRRLGRRILNRGLRGESDGKRGGEDQRTMHATEFITMEASRSRL